MTTKTKLIIAAGVGVFLLAASVLLGAEQAVALLKVLATTFGVVAL